jgi:two-component system sensor histidine kinase KdpD
MMPLRAHLSIATPALILVAPVIAGVAIGGLVSGVLAVVAGFVAYDVLFIPPYGTLSVGAAQNWVALVVYVVVMLIVARVVSFLQQARAVAHRHEEATRRLYELTDLLIGDKPIDEVLSIVASTVHQLFGARGVAVLLPQSDAHEDGWQGLRVAAVAGAPLGEDAIALASAPGQVEHLRLSHGSESITRIALSARGRAIAMIVIAGPELDRHGTELLTIYTSQAALALERGQLREQAVRNELLTEVDRLRSAMTGAVSHDLRTPLASMKTAVSALRQPSGETGPGLSIENRNELLALVEDQIDALDRLVANLLDMTRIRFGALDLRTAIVPIPEIVDGALRTSAVASAQVVVQLDVELPPVEVDQILVEQAVANLLDNAARYSPTGDPIVVTARQKCGVVVLSVADSGPGVPLAERERVFQMFNRAPGGGRAGLGLSIVKAFVEAHGQDVSVDDAPGGGAQFSITLPAAQVPAQTA